jgi:hypothetical protein
VSVLWAIGLVLAAAGQPDPESFPTKTLWQIESVVPGGAEFALGLDDFHLYPSRFPDGPLFVVGESDPQRAWAPVQPGPADAWAGSRPHVFEVRFGLDGSSPIGACRLIIDLYDAHRSNPPKLRVRINELVCDLQTAAGTADAVEMLPSDNRPQRIVVDIPASELRSGDNTLTITSIAGAWLVYNRLALEVPDETGSSPVRPATRIVSGWTRPVVFRRPDGSRHQQIRLVVEHSGGPTEVMAAVPGEAPVPVALVPGRQEVDVPAPFVEAPAPTPVALRVGGRTVAGRQIDLIPVRPWVVYVLHHTHLDIGYTHVQSQVEKLQWMHLERAVELARASAQYEDDARFRWNPEGLWAVDSYLQQASPEQRARLIDAARQGSIGLDALYANELTGLCRPEELFEVVSPALRLAQTHGLTIDSAMMSDIPGLTWGIVPALARSGVKYLSLAPNRGHRIGYALSAWGDKPFYWLSPSGENKVLVWMAGKGYSWFHGGWRGADTFNYDHVETALDGEKVLDYLEELQRNGYPYELVQLRYNIGSDNGPPDAGLSDFVRSWNERHVTPRLVITTTREMCRALEQRHGDELPVFRGDFTPYWEDGAASSARETALNRDAAERLVQAAALWALLDPAAFPREGFREAWRNVVLYDEHTWGSWNSISEPDAEFTRQQWAVKQRFAEEADRRSRDLLEGACASVAQDGPVSAVMVFNTCSWARSGLVELPPTWSVAGETVQDDAGDVVPAQRLRTGGLAFLARDVPPLGAARFTIGPGRADRPSEVTARQSRLANGRVAIVVDGDTGGIRSLKHRSIPSDLVDPDADHGLNEYLYVAGRSPDDPQRSGPVRIEVVENGPIVASLRIESEAPGCYGLSRELRLIAGADHVEIINRINKQRVLAQEGVHFAFPLQVPQGEVRFDIAWGIVRSGQDQLPGACKNHLTAQRWVDVSNRDFGLTLATIDAPLVEVGAIRADPLAVGWIEELEPSATLYSYVMNNYWETNFLAGQEGLVSFRYALLPHGPFDAAAAHRFGTESSQPLIVVPMREGMSPPVAPLRMDPGSVVVTSLRPSEDGEALMIRLFNPSERPQQAVLRWPRAAPAAVWISSPFEDRARSLTGSLTLPPWGIATLRCEH